MAAPPLIGEQSRGRRAALRRRLDGLVRTFDHRYLPTDPLVFVHRYEEEADREIVGFLAASLAFGNVRAIQASLEAALGTIGDRPSRFVDRFEHEAHAPALDPLYHRWIRGRDLAAVFAVLRRMREQSGSIGRFFMAGHRPDHPDIGAALASFSERARALADGADGPVNRKVKGRAPGPIAFDDGRSWATAGGERRPPTVAPFFPSPRDGSACKRLNLYLRWMVRDGDGLDLGLWKDIPRRQLVLPLDTHLARLSRALGLTRRRTPGWAMAVEATRALALFDPDDPVRYDFALSRLGILDLCLHGRDPLDCRRCPPPRVRTRASSRRVL